MADINQPNIQHHNITGWTTWVGFAGFLMAFAGIFHIILGIGGILGQDWYVYGSGSAYLFDSSAWGWSMVTGGILLTMSAALLLAGNMIGRIVGVLLASASLLVNLALIPAAPIWSVIAVVFDVTIIYAIIAHGGELKQPDR